MLWQKHILNLDNKKVGNFPLKTMTFHLQP